jgi:hypothetical protein
MKVIIIIGLPCSGKTWLTNQISLGIIPIIDDSIWLGRDVLSAYAFDELKNGYILTHPFLCKKETLQFEIDWINKTFNSVKVNIECVYFENNIEKCLKNLEYRMRSGDLRNTELSIRRLAEEYNIPDSINALPIWQP